MLLLGSVKGSPVRVRHSGHGPAGDWSGRGRRRAGRAANPSLVEGVYAGMRGPSVQTLAETRMVTTAEGTGEALDPEEVMAVAHDTARRVAPVIPAVLLYALTGPAPDAGRIRRQQS